ncbi:MAG: hypothetical protein KKB50_20545 [Planctomycetes bacterium]|nr:hypothetical protein [Planctomycetota bacterium]
MTTPQGSAEPSTPEFSVRRALAPRRAALVAALLVLAGVANQSRSLGWGFMWDDYVHQLVLREALPGSHLRPWSLFDFGRCAAAGTALFESGLLPWWTDADFAARFFRPVTSLSIWLDHALYGDWAVGYHLTSLALFGVLLVLAQRLFRALGVAGAAVLWGLAFLALDDVHGFPVGWIANRNTLLASLFIVATCVCLTHYAAGRKPAWLGGAAVCLLLACTSKESGLAAYPLAMLYLLLFDRRPEREALPAGVARVLRSPACWTLTILTAGFLTFYVLAGYGATSVIYPTPWHDPAAYLSRVCVLIPLGLSGLLFGFMLDLIAEHGDWLWPALGATIVLVPPALWVILRTTRLTRPVLFAGGWAICSLIVEAGGDLSDRLLMNASIGTALLIGLYFGELGSWRVRAREGHYARLAVAGVLLLAGIVSSVPRMALLSLALGRLGAGNREIIASADIARSVPGPRDVMLLNGPDPLLPLSMGATWRVVHTDYQTRVLPLQMAGRGLRWRRLDQHTMTVTSLSTPFLTNRFELVFRSSRATPSMGQTYETTAFTATIAEVDAAGVQTISFRFVHALDDPACQFLVWDQGKLARIPPPAIGETLELPDVPPPKLY